MPKGTFASWLAVKDLLCAVTWSTRCSVLDREVRYIRPPLQPVPRGGPTHSVTKNCCFGITSHYLCMRPVVQDLFMTIKWLHLSTKPWNPPALINLKDNHPLIDSRTSSIDLAISKQQKKKKRKQYKTPMETHLSQQNHPRYPTRTKFATFSIRLLNK